MVAHERTAQLLLLGEGRYDHVSDKGLLWYIKPL